MSDPEREAVELQPPLLLALRLKSAVTGRSVADLVNDAVRDSLAGDAASARRKRAPSRSLDEVVTKLRRRGMA